MLHARFLYQGFLLNCVLFGFVLFFRWGVGASIISYFEHIEFKLSKHGEVYSLSLIKNEHLRWHQNSVFITFAQVFQVFLKGIFFQHLHY